MKYVNLNVEELNARAMPVKIEKYLTKVTDSLPKSDNTLKILIAIVALVYKYGKLITFEKVSEILTKIWGQKVIH